jgi:hypothetical protein
VHTIDTALTNVEREWQAYGVSRRDRAALAADLRVDLQSAADSGARPEELIGADVRGFARRLADEAGVHRSQAEYGRVVGTSIIGSGLGLVVGFALVWFLHPVMVALVDLPRGEKFDRIWMWAGILLFYAGVVAGVTVGAVLAARLRLGDLPHIGRTTRAMALTMPLAGTLLLPVFMGVPELLGQGLDALFVTVEVALILGVTVGAIVLARRWATRAPAAA